MNRRPLAKAAYRLGGHAAKIKRPMRIYALDLDNMPSDEEGAFNATFAGWRWMSINTCWRLMELSERLDPQHWEHWALVHNEDCCVLPAPCPECGGTTCEATRE
jgi:hypothetical protein